MYVLLVNDDGIHAPGLRALHRELTKFAEVQVVAPLVEQSGVGHQITYRKPIMVHEVRERGEHFGWCVDGSPADCTKLGVLEFCDKQPDVVLSGINSGANVGINVLYSGTVAAAIEGAFFGITSIALSQYIKSPPDYDTTAKRAVQLVRRLLEIPQIERHLWNVNFPESAVNPPKGIKFCRMGVKRHTDRVERRADPRGKPYFWSGLDPLRSHEMTEGADVKELFAGYVTVTPLRFDITDDPLLSQMGEISTDGWTLDGTDDADGSR